MSVTERLDDFQQRHPAAGFPIAVVYKFGDDQGGNLAALVTYFGFLSIFPLLLVLSTVLGLVLSGDADLQKRVLDSALGQFPLIGQDLGTPKKIGGGTLGLVVGLLGSLYGALGVGAAVQNAMNTAWAIPKNSRPNPFKTRGISLLLLLTVGLGLIGTTALTALGGAASSFGVPAKVGLTAASVALNAAIFVLAFRLATARELTARQVAPGAITAAVVWQLLQSFGTIYAAHVANTTSVSGGIFAVVLGLIAFLSIASTALVLCIEINVVRVKELHPRALLTPFTDSVDLTEGDKEAYTDAAKAQRSKGFQNVDVTFGERPE